MKGEGRVGGSELGSDLNLDPDPWKTLWIRIRQNDADPLDPDPQNCLRVFSSGINFLLNASRHSFGGKKLIQVPCTLKTNILVMSREKNHSAEFSLFFIF